jgi:hypothetical protein
MPPESLVSPAPEQVEGAPADSTGRGVLSPIDRLTELFYGIILVLTFTGTLRVASQGRDDVRTTLWAAVGCSIAWGLVDGCMYVFSCRVSRNRSYSLARQLREEPAAARATIMASVPSAVARALSPAEWDRVVAALGRVDVPPLVGVKRDDLVGGVAIFALANATLLPLAAPFALIGDLALAQHVSNGLALALLFAVGCGLARYTGERPLRVGLLLVAFGLALVAATIALGG